MDNNNNNNPAAQVFARSGLRRTIKSYLPGEHLDYYRDNRDSIFRNGHLEVIQLLNLDNFTVPELMESLEREHLDVVQYILERQPELADGITRPTIFEEHYSVLIGFLNIVVTSAELEGLLDRCRYINVRTDPYNPHMMDNFNRRKPKHQSSASIIRFIGYIMNRQPDLGRAVRGSIFRSCLGFMIKYINIASLSLAEVKSSLDYYIRRENARDESRRDARTNGRTIDYVEGGPIKFIRMLLDHPDNPPRIKHLILSGTRAVGGDASISPDEMGYDRLIGDIGLPYMEATGIYELLRFNAIGRYLENHQFISRHKPWIIIALDKLLTPEAYMRVFENLRSSNNNKLIDNLAERDLDLLKNLGLWLILRRKYTILRMIRPYFPKQSDFTKYVLSKLQNERCKEIHDLIIEYDQPAEEETASSFLFSFG